MWKDAAVVAGVVVLVVLAGCATGQIDPPLLTLNGGDIHSPAIENRVGLLNQNTGGTSSGGGNSGNGNSTAPMYTTRKGVRIPLTCPPDVVNCDAAVFACKLDALEYETALRAATGITDCMGLDGNPADGIPCNGSSSPLPDVCP